MPVYIYTSKTPTFIGLLGYQYFVCGKDPRKLGIEIRNIGIPYFFC